MLQNDNCIQDQIRNRFRGKPMKHLLLFCSLILLPAQLMAQDSYESFNWLTPIIVDHTPVGDIRVLYNESVTTVLNRKVAPDVYEETGEETIQVVETRLDAKSDDHYVIEYFPGLSVDPVFTIFKKSKDGLTELKSLGGTEIIIPGNGNIYTSGHTNSMFNERRKYVLTADGIKEVPQPLLYVGIKTEIRKPITIYSTKALKSAVARLPEGSSIEVLASDKDEKLYLVKTGFGLLGWYDASGHQPLGYQKENPIPGLYFNGD